MALFVKLGNHLVAFTAVIPYSISHNGHNKKSEHQNTEFCFQLDLVHATPIINT